MNPNTLKNIEELVKSVEAGTFTGNDIELLFVKLRTITNSKVIIELANFITHSEGRDKGSAYELTQGFSRNVADVAESQGGSISGTNPLFESKQIIFEIITALRAVGIYLNEGRIRKQQHKIVDSLLSSMDQVVIVIKDDRISECKLQKEGDTLYASFKFKNLKPGVMFIGENAVIQTVMLLNPV